MTAKKMADIFFGNFSKLISQSKDLEKNEKIENPNPKEEKSSSKIMMITLIGLISIAILAYFIAYK